MPSLQANEPDSDTSHSHPQTSARRNSGFKSSKLRDSCQACALSKIKCPKEKPACSRCESRGITCEYFLTKRPGRRRESSIRRSSKIASNASSKPNANKDNSRPGDTVHAEQQSLGSGILSRNTIPFTPTDLSRSNSFLTSPSLISTSPINGNVPGTDSSDVSPALWEVSMSPGLTSSGSEVHGFDFFMSAMDSAFEMPALDSGSINHTGADFASLLIPSESVDLDLVSKPMSTVDLPSAWGLSSLSSNNPVPLNGKANMADVSEPTSCDCLTLALDLLKMLSSARGSPRGSSTGLDTMATSTENDINSIQTVLTKNKQSIEAVNSMLACSCAEDGFLLTILSMIVLKMLGAYAAAARAKLHDAGAETGKPTILTNCIIFSNNDQLRRLSSLYDAPSDENGSERMAAQLVLGELHRVQRLVNQLSPRLKGALEERERESRLEQDLWNRQRVMGESEPMTMAPFSASTLDQVDSDLRKSLSNLSAGIISRLRQS